MKEGTISIIIGCHSPFHSLLVLIAWKKLYKKWPKLWQIVCIFLHDIGHFGKNYLSCVEQKNQHWATGAYYAYIFFGYKAFLFTAGHSSRSGYELSRLYKADKYSWYIAPKWWIFKNCIFEPKIAMGYKYWEATLKFKKQVKNSIESGKFKSTHQLYLERCKK